MVDANIINTPLSDITSSVLSQPVGVSASTGKVKFSRVKFYADVPGECINKLFTWRVRGLSEVDGCIARFMNKGWRIRAIWFEWIDEHGKVIENVRIPKDSLVILK